MLFINSFKVRQIIKTNQIEILHVNDLYNMIGVVLKFIKPNLKVVYHVRLLPGSYAAVLYRFWIRLVFRYADSIVCVSQTVFKSLPVTRKKFLIYDALPVPPNKKGAIKNSRFTFLYPANYIQGKGHKHALNAFKAVYSQLGQAQLIFVGGDLGKGKNRNYLNELKQQVDKCRLTEHVIFFDQANNLETFYRSADVVLNFSESESFSMTCLESLLFGTPVIATRCGGPEEIIEHEVNGLLVTNRNIAEMKAALVRLYQDADLRKHLANNAIKVAEKFSLVESSKKMHDLYTSLLDLR
jgi:glycosyltransferase involved in cell wall biosynthesis